MPHPTEQSVFLRWTDPNTKAVARNSLVEIRPAGDLISGLGLFAVREIPRGTRIIEEAPMIVLPDTQSIDDKLDAFCSAFQQLTEAERSIFDQLHCDYSDDMTPKLLNAVRRWRRRNLTHDTDGNWLDERRCTEVSHIIYDRFYIFLANCVYFGVGNVSDKGLFALFSRINHSCVPNAYWAFNAAIERLTVHAIRHIRVGEQITISYIKDPIAPKQVRTFMLAPWKFSCSCAACTDPAMEARIGRIQELKRLLALYDAKYKSMDKALAEFSVSMPPKMEALPAAMELVALLEKQGIAGMELASAYVCFHF
ncbi:TPR domain protein [Beauveria brongniartii RCEF 3172]|uniref:TPR domain protein n=1 Tax=Beauveria brongniartii RCEF 3172 TaxID=1081107 RepID=A0A167AIM1_9HYPO|nr:TPR domain protein [Beauveria brongniartii RCEF 3172]